jgi:hypothetical protein
MNLLRMKNASKPRHPKAKAPVTAPRSAKPRRHCSGFGIVDTTGRWQPRLEDY